MKRHIVQGMAAALVYFCIVLFMPSGWAGTEQTISSNLPEETQENPPEISHGMGAAPAVVMIHNRPIVFFFAPLPGSTTEQRVKLAEERITRVLSGKNLGKVTSREIAPGIIISIGNNDLLLITPEDANLAFGQTKKEIVDRAVRNLTLAVDEVKEMRSPHFILMAAGYTLLATILYVATLWGLHRSSRWTEARVKKMEEKWMS